MLGASTFGEFSIADQGIVAAGTSDISFIFESSNPVANFLLDGSSSLSANLTQTAAGIYITGSSNADISSNFVLTTTNIKLVNEATQSSAFTFSLTSAAIEVALGASTQELSFTKTTFGDILYVDVVTDTAIEIYTEINPRGY